jgi:5-methylcytosine-specific restriction protein A
MVKLWTPDEVILVCAAVKANGWEAIRADQVSTQDRAHELSELLIAAPIVPIGERDSGFRSPASIQRKSYDLTTQLPEYAGKPTKGSKLDREILARFLAEPAEMDTIARAIESTILRGEVKSSHVAEPSLSDDTAATEGRLLLAAHVRRERNPSLRRAKLASVTMAGNPIACQVCTFDFAETYGTVGECYIEVHHVLPLYASGPRTTRLDDLALLCANCHRMIHRARPWLTPDALQAMMTISTPVRPSGRVGDVLQPAPVDHRL